MAGSRRWRGALLRVAPTLPAKSITIQRQATRHAVIQELSMRPLLLTLMCVATLMLAGCGNKGPLFMPEAKPTPPAAAAAPAHASTAATPAQH